MKVLLCMVYLHLIDDYVLQGWLASAKCKSWWEHNCPNEKYKNDYIIALIEHAFMNSFFIHIPIYLWLCQNEFCLILTLLFMTAVHAKVDHLKANKKKINLWQDQLIHIITVLWLWATYYFIFLYMELRVK